MEYVPEIIDLFHQHAHSANAEPMKKYMKHKFEFLGIKTPERRVLARPFLQKDKLPTLEQIPELVKALWEQEAREFQYFAIQLLIKVSKKAPPEWDDLYEYLIVEKSWWDTVDGLAGWLVGSHFIRYPDLIADCTNRWMESDNIWLQRTCLLYQLNYKENTDFELLKSFILPLKESKEFFIQKAIGWALRQYSKTNADAVTQFVSSTPLAPLSSREALRLINNTAG